eukprot:gene33903-biopygen26838
MHSSPPVVFPTPPRQSLTHEPLEPIATPGPFSDPAPSKPIFFNLPQGHWAMRKSSPPSRLIRRTLPSTCTTQESLHDKPSVHPDETPPHGRQRHLPIITIHAQPFAPATCERYSPLSDEADDDAPGLGHTETSTPMCPTTTSDSLRPQHDSPQRRRQGTKAEVVSDSGAQANCFPQRIIDANPQLVTHITPAPPRTALVFGNNQSQATTQLAHINDYTAHITPSSMPDCIIAHAPIIDAGHIIIETKTEIIIRNIGEQYEVRYPKTANSNEWPLPLDVLNQLSNLRRNYPLTIDDTARMLQPFCFESAWAIHVTHDDGLTRPPLSYIYSSRILRCPKGVSTRSHRFHECCGHISEDSMCATQPGFDSPVWVNAPVTIVEIRAAFYDVVNIQDLTELHLLLVFSQLGLYTAGFDLWCLLLDSQLAVLMCGCFLEPVQNTKGRKIFTYPTRHNDDAAYHKCIGKVLAFFKNLYLSRPELGTRPQTQTIIRTDRFKTFLSEKSQQFYLDNNCLHQPASAYPHHQVAAERDIQTIVQNVAAAVHTNDFIRVSSWDDQAVVVHWIELHGHIPLSESGLTAHQMLYRGSTSEDHKKHWIVNCDKQYRFAFGDIVVHPLEKGIEYKKFSLKNDVGFYMGNDTSDSFREAFLELAPHYYHYEGDRFEDNPAIITPDMSPDPELTAASGPDTGEDLSDHDEPQVSNGQPALTDAGESPGQSPTTKRAVSPTHKRKAKHTLHRNYRSNADKIVLPVYTKRMGPRELRPRERLDYNKVNRVVDSSPQAIIEQIVARTYRISTLLERYVPVDDIGNDSISVGKALNIDAAIGDKKFEHSIKAEILDNLITKTGTLEAISHEEVKALPEHTFIHTVVKCKRKQNSDGTYDKHNARTAARDDEYLRILLARGRPTPASFSPTINSLTFQSVLQVASYTALLKTSSTLTLTRRCLKIRSPSSQSSTTTSRTSAAFPVDSFIAFARPFMASLHPAAYSTSTTQTKYYQVTLDTKGDSFLGIQFTRQPDGSTILTQPKLLHKLLKEYPSIGRKYTQDHPASEPTTADKQRLMYIVEYIRKTQDRGHQIYAASGDPLQFCCTVDASYLLHPESKGQTDYTIGLYKEGTFYNSSA